MSETRPDTTGSSGTDVPRPSGTVPAPPPQPVGPLPTTPAPTGLPVRDGGGDATGSPTGSSTDGGTKAVAAEQAKQVASTAGEGAKEVVGEARQQAREVAGVARDQAMDAMRSAQGELRGHASQQTDRAAVGLASFADQIKALVDGRTDEAGQAADYARQAGDKVSQLAGRLQDGGFDGLVDDLRGFARRRPGLFLIGAAAAGFAAGRMIRASRDDESDDEVSGEPYAGTNRMAGGGFEAPVGSAYPSTGDVAGVEFPTGRPSAGSAGGDVIPAPPDLAGGAPGRGHEAGR